MHEYVYADRILQTVLEELGSQKKASMATVEVGEMLGLTRESLSSAYKILSRGTRAEGSKLRVRFSKGGVQCPNCGFAGRMNVGRHEHRVDPAFACPKCGTSLKVTSGLDVKLIGFE